MDYGAHLNASSRNPLYKHLAPSGDQMVAAQSRRVTNRSRPSTPRVSNSPVARDKSICAALGTNPTELEGLLNKSRQTISRHIEANKLFTFDDLVKVANAKIDDEGDRSKLISELSTRWFPEVIK